MNKKQKLTALFLALCLTSGNAAMAAGRAPASQFGFKGWPYRQSNGCNTPATAQPTTAPNVTCTPEPTAIPTQESTAQPTIQPTAAPTATPVPTTAPKPTKPAATTPPSTGDDYTTPSISVQEENAFILVNQDRIANGLPTLTLDPVLCGIARAKSRDMHEKNYFSHTSPTYGSASSMLKQFGYSFNAVGENIAHHANINKAQAAFMSSTGHRRNILGSQWSKVGIGVWKDSQGFVYVTQLFVR